MLKLTFSTPLSTIYILDLQIFDKGYKKKKNYFTLTIARMESLSIFAARFSAQNNLIGTV